jgi:hypothetical protein
MKKQFRYKTDKELKTKRNDADRSLYRAKCRFVKWDLTIRMGRSPTQHEILGVVCDNPLTIIEVRERIRAFKRERLAKRRLAEQGDPINTWESLNLPFDRRNSTTEEDALLHLQMLRDNG